mmetsp:Transcript_54680/g.123601  ORF Transcript_54680/g.123601 Transcript_54680/m.123601 type:complete len:235 (-) Transcript_54680:326-1030(-)
MSRSPGVCNRQLPRLISRGWSRLLAHRTGWDEAIARGLLLLWRCSATPGLEVQVCRGRLLGQELVRFPTWSAFRCCCRDRNRRCWCCTWCPGATAWCHGATTRRRGATSTARSRSSATTARSRSSATTARRLRAQASRRPGAWRAVTSNASPERRRHLGEALGRCRRDLPEVGLLARLLRVRQGHRCEIHEQRQPLQPTQIRRGDGGRRAAPAMVIQMREDTIGLCIGEAKGPP